MTIQLLSADVDSRLKAYCVNARCSFGRFLELTSGAEENLRIQRQIIKGSKPYATLRADLKRGCVLPPIVLAVKNVQGAMSPSEVISNGFLPQREHDLLNLLADPINNVAPGDVYIIDGLQRTNAIRQTFDELDEPQRTRFLEHTVRLELWVNIPFGAVAYRMLLLNAGQKPMSIKHQVEILSMKLQEELSAVPRISIITSMEGQRRTQAGQFHLSRLAQAFQAWLQGQPSVDLKNLVMEQLLAESAIDTLGASLETLNQSGASDSFVDFVKWLVDVDYVIFPEESAFLANETVIQGLAAAVGSAEKNPSLKERKDRALAQLLQDIQSNKDADPLGIASFNSLRMGIDPSRANVGQATRDMVYRAFREFFLADGTKPMSECWQFGAG